MNIEQINIDLAYEALFEGNVKKAKSFLNNLENIKTIDNSSLLMLLGYIFLEEKSFDQACESQLKLLEIARNKEEEHIAHHQITMVLREMGNYEDALNHIKDEFEIIKSHFNDDYLKLSVNYYEQGFLHMKLNHMTLSEEFLRQSLAYALKTDDLISQACSFRALGELYNSQMQKSKALENFNKSKFLFLEANDLVGAEEVEELIKQL